MQVMFPQAFSEVNNRATVLIKGAVLMSCFVITGLALGRVLLIWVNKKVKLNIKFKSWCTNMKVFHVRLVKGGLYLCTPS